MASLARVKAFACFAVLLAVAVHSSEVQVLEGDELRQDGASTPEMTVVERDGKQVPRINREAFFRGDVDSDEASLDNGDDSNLSELWANAASQQGDLGESDDVSADPPAAKKPAAKPAAPAAKPAPKADGKPAVPALPQISKTDEKYMPAIMDKLVNMRKEMAVLKGANWEEILEQHRDGVVQILVVKKKFLWKAAYRSALSEQISGSGFFIKNEEFGVSTKDDLLVVTNAHVAKNAAQINLLVPSLGQEPIPAKVVGLCSQRDIAILKVVNKAKLLDTYKTKTGKTDIVRMSLGDSDEMKRGARVMAVGYPLGLKSVKASMGIVSGYQQFKSALYLQITAPINPGNSGGPLFNEKGQVVGINSAKIASASGMSFSISSVQLKVMLDVLYQRRQFIVPYLGYGFSVGTKLIQGYLNVDPKIKATGGVYITKVHPNGLFKEAGAKMGDLLISVDGANIDRFGQTWMPTMKDNINILGLLARKKIGTDLTLGVWRKSEGKVVKLTTKYDETPKFAVPYIYEPLLQKPRFQIFAGVVFMELVENLVETLLDSNVKELIKFMSPEARMKPAVIIAGVLPGSLADLDGSVKPGLIVQKFNGKPINSILDICGVLQAHKSDWYTLATSKTFTALKKADVEKDAKSDPEMQGKSAGFCASKPKALTVTAAKTAAKPAAKTAANPAPKKAAVTQAAAKAAGVVAKAAGVVAKPAAAKPAPKVAPKEAA